MAAPSMLFENKMYTRDDTIQRLRNVSTLTWVATGVPSPESLNWAMDQLELIVHDNHVPVKVMLTYKVGAGPAAQLAWYGSFVAGDVTTKHETLLSMVCDNEFNLQNFEVTLLQNLRTTGLVF